MHPVFNPIAHYRYLHPNLYLSVADIANPDLCVCSSRTWISLDIARFYEEHVRHAGKNGNRVPIPGAGWVDTICTGFDRPL